MVKRPFWVFFVLVSLAFAPARAQLIAVPLPDSSSQPTQTFLWKAKEARAVLIHIPGGEGVVGLTPNKPGLETFRSKILTPLSDPSMTSGSISAVLFDSPYPMARTSAYPASRASPDHLRRIESVVAFYKERFGKPVWLMGHSNGSISVAEFIHTRSSVLGGAIFAGSRKELKVSPATALPILFLHHKHDACVDTDYRSARSAFDAVKSSRMTNVAFVTLEGGSSLPGNECHTGGYHSFFGDEASAYRAIDEFIGTN